MPADLGNFRPRFTGRVSKLTPEIRDLFVQTIRATGRFTIACRKCAVSTQTAYTWKTKGALQRRGPYRDFLDATERAAADFLGMAAGRHHQLATGGVLRLPHVDEKGAPVRDHVEDCEEKEKERPKCACPVMITERVVMPSESALRYELDRLDPQGTPGEGVAVLPGLSEADRVARATVHFDLLVDALQTMSSLGVELAQLMPPDAFETTATPVPANGKPDSRG